MLKLYTIGYATKPLDTFIEQLKRHNIDVVADVRSVPYSKIFHDYHKEAITKHLYNHGMRYVYLGEELGPRSKDDRHYDEAGQVQFDRLMQSPLFLQGVDRLKSGLNKALTIALMCAEKDAITCHRSLLLGYFLTRHQLSNNPKVGFDIMHITHDGNLENQTELEKRLVTLHALGGDLFLTQQECQNQAYELQLKATSYRKS